MNKTLQTIHSLKSIHGDFTEKDITKEDLDTILCASIRAANAGNAQNYSIIVVADKSIMQEVSGCTASRMLVYCVDYQRNKDIAEHLGLSYLIDPSWALITGTADASLAAQTAVIAAQSLGIGSLISNGVQRNDPLRLWDLLKLPKKNCFPVLAVYLGYANKAASAHKSGRLGIPGVIHEHVYRARDEEDIAQLLEITDSAGFGPLGGWKEKGYNHYLEGFFKGPGSRASTMYRKFGLALEKAGFKVMNSD